MRDPVYANRTNVREGSDVDVCALYDGTFHYRLPPGITEDQLGIVPASYQYQQYKNEVEQALVDYFGRANIVRGNKALDIHEITYCVDADAVAVPSIATTTWPMTGKSTTTRAQP